MPTASLLHSIRDRWRTVLFAVLLIQGIFSVLAARYGLLVALIPLLGAIGVTSVLMPQWGLLLLVVAWFFPVNLTQGIGILPAHVVLITVLIGYTIRHMSEGKPLIVKTPLNIWIALWSVSALISVSLSSNVSRGLLNWSHHIILFGLFVAIAGMTESKDMRRTVLVFIAVCALIAPFNILDYVIAGGRVRAFGPTGVRFSGFLALGSAFATAAFAFSKSRRHTMVWGGVLALLVVGQFVNQSRGAMLQLLSGMVFAAIIAYRWSGIHQKPHVRQRIFRMAMAAAVLALIAGLTAMPLIQTTLSRFASEGSSAKATAQMRVFLWKTALQTFTERPIFGMGLSQEYDWYQVVPEMRFSPWFAATRGLSTHNSFLGYLATTGLVGSVLLFMLLARALSMGRGFLRDTTDDSQAMWITGLWSMVFVIVSRYLYEGHVLYSIGGMTTVTFMALLFCIGRQTRSPGVE